MAKSRFKSTLSRPLDWAIAAGIALLAAVSFLPAVAGYVFPGRSARLVSGWLGASTLAFGEYPLMALFVKPFGCSNVLAALFGAVAAVTLYHLVAFFLYGRIGGEYTKSDAYATSRIGGAVAAFVFLFAPAVIVSSTHLEPSLFDAAWALVSLAIVMPFARLPRKTAWLAPCAMGVMAGMGVADTVVFIALLPLYVGFVWAVGKLRGGKGYGAAALFLLFFFIAVFAWSVRAVGDFGEYWAAQKLIFRSWNYTPGSYLVALFAIAPFVISLFSSAKAFGSERNLVNWTFHTLFTVVSILAVATALSPSAVLLPTGVPPVLTTAFAAATAGYLMAYWWGQTRAVVVVNESIDTSAAAKAMAAKSRRVGIVAGSVFAVVLAVSALINRFAAVDAESGAFADAVADMIVADMGERSWIVTDGVLDDHLLLAARRAGKKLHVISLVRENDTPYIDALADAVAAGKICGDETDVLVDILRRHRGLHRMRLVPFIQKWFSTDPGIASKAVVFGAPDLWFYSNAEPVPELLFYGADPSRKGDWSRWKELSAILHAPKGWGSYSLQLPPGKGDAGLDAVERMRLDLRRHVGFVATNCGYAFQERGRKLQGEGKTAEAKEFYNKAFEMYELVLGEIDPDNVVALVNEVELANSGTQKALAKVKQLTAALKAMSEDENRRYTMGDLSLLYGYVCNPELIFKRGLSLFLKSARPGEGMNQLRRALEFVAAEDRASVELRVMAALYAQGSAEDKLKARAIYDSALTRDATNREALSGLARLEMLEGNNAKAIEYLEKAVALGGSEPADLMNAATLKILKDDFIGAKALLRKVTDGDSSNVAAWTLLASVVFRQLDALTGVAEGADKANMKAALEAELESEIIPAMERQTAGEQDYRVYAIKAYMLLRKGGEENMKAARDAFSVASSLRPDIAATSDIVLGLDIQLNDQEDAERRAAKVLDTNNDDPMANYVMGSIALRNEDLASAERHLRRAVACQNPSPMALNDLAEVLRRKKNFDEAEKFARRATEVAPNIYVVWETLGSTLMDAGKSFDEAEACVQKACDLSRAADGKVADVRMLISLARVQIKRGELVKGKLTLRSVVGRLGELTEFEKREFEELRKSVK